MPAKIKHILKFSSNADEPALEIPENINKTDFPAGRQLFEATGAETERTLTANMTGQVTLTGETFDLQFNRGALRRITREGNVLFDKLNSRTRFITGEEKIEYRNESAFAFDSESDYGLRTLQVPKKKNDHSRRVITDFIFNRLSEEAYITCCIDYPEFNDGSTVLEASIFELRFSFKNQGLKIITEDRNDEVEVPVEADLYIPGRSFTISGDGKKIRLSCMEEYNSRKFSQITGLPIRTASSHGKTLLFLNPGGSYVPAPAEYYSGISERLCFKLELL